MIFVLLDLLNFFVFVLFSIEPIFFFESFCWWVWGTFFSNLFFYRLLAAKLVLPGGCAFHKFSQNVTSFHKFSQHENRYKIVKAGEKW